MVAIVNSASAMEIAIHDGAQWAAIMTRPRCEKIVSRYCAEHDITCYLPLRRRAKRYQRRTVETWLPMFPGYLFAQLDPVKKTILLESHKIAHILTTNPDGEAVLVEELRMLQKLENVDAEAELEVLPEIVPGKIVRITDGPLAGVNGIIERRTGKVRVTLNIEILGQAVSVEIDVGDMVIDPNGSMA